MRALASRLERETTATVDLLKADLTASDELARVEARLREDHRIGILVNNAGAAAHGSFADPDLDATERLIRLNVTALTRLAGAVIPRYLQQGGGAIVNLASVLALVAEFPMGAYGATKAYVLALSQNLQSELGSRGIYVQAVQPNFFNTRPAERYLTG
ncbi:MAG: SDR family NAD(P)-dependent oxidoreductase [Steroidobacterales bacterium]